MKLEKKYGNIKYCRSLKETMPKPGNIITAITLCALLSVQLPLYAGAQVLCIQANGSAQLEWSCECDEGGTPERGTPESDEGLDHERDARIQSACVDIYLANRDLIASYIHPRPSYDRPYSALETDAGIVQDQTQRQRHYLYSLLNRPTTPASLSTTILLI